MKEEKYKIVVEYEKDLKGTITKEFFIYKKGFFGWSKINETKNDSYVKISFDSYEKAEDYITKIFVNKYRGSVYLTKDENIFTLKLYTESIMPG